MKALGALLIFLADTLRLVHFLPLVCHAVFVLCTMKIAMQFISRYKLGLAAQEAQ